MRVLIAYAHHLMPVITCARITYDSEFIDNSSNPLRRNIPTILPSGLGQRTGGSAGVNQASENCNDKKIVGSRVRASGLGEAKEGWLYVSSENVKLIKHPDSSNGTLS